MSKATFILIFFSWMAWHLKYLLLRAANIKHLDLRKTDLKNLGMARMVADKYLLMFQSLILRWPGGGGGGGWMPSPNRFF